MRGGGNGLFHVQLIDNLNDYVTLTLSQAHPSEPKILTGKDLHFLLADPLIRSYIVQTHAYLHLCCINFIF